MTRRTTDLKPPISPRERRIRRLWVKCTSLGYSKYRVTDGIDPDLKRIAMSRFVYDPRFKYFYARVPKAANSSIVAALALHSGDDYDRAGQDVWKVGMNILPTWREYRNAFRFTVVRDPTDRALSGFLDKSVRKTKEKVPHLEDSPEAFVTFLEALKAQRYLRNAHFAPQAQLVPRAAGGMHRVGRVETLGEDLPEIMKEIFGDTTVSSPEIRHHATGASEKRDAYLTQASVDLLTDLYAEDYRTFGYTPPRLRT